MRALVCRQYGPPELLRVEEVATPTPGPGEVLVRNRAAAANAGDRHACRGEPAMLRLMGFGFLRPANPILGVDIAGEVAAVGEGVSQFSPGDAVVGCTAIGDSVSEYGGAFAEYVCVPEGKLVEKPARLSFEEAAAMPQAALSALQAVRDCAQVAAGQRVLINGAAGGVGSFAVQLAVAAGAQVTAVCSPGGHALVRRLGAVEVIDYRSADFVDGGRRFDCIIDAAAYRSIHDIKRAIVPGGRYVLIGGATSRFFQASLLGPLISRLTDIHVTVLNTRETQDDLAHLAVLAEAGTVTPVIDRRFTLAEGAAAMQYLDAGHTRGKVVITV